MGEAPPSGPARRRPRHVPNAATWSCLVLRLHAAHALPDLLADLGYLCRNTLRIAHAEHTFTRLSTPTPLQATALNLLDLKLDT